MSDLIQIEKLPLIDHLTCELRVEIMRDLETIIRHYLAERHYALLIYRQLPPVESPFSKCFDANICNWA